MTLAWTVYARQAGDRLVFHDMYNLFEREGGWRILVATVFD